MLKVYEEYKKCFILFTAKSDTQEKALLEFEELVNNMTLYEFMEELKAWSEDD